MSKITNFILQNLIFPHKSYKDILRQQERTLLKNLRYSYGTELDRKYRLRSIRTIEEYQKRVPVHHYDDLHSLWQAEYEGDRGKTLARRPLRFAMTSGTTGKSKLIPFSPRIMHGYRQGELYTLGIYLKQNPASSLIFKKNIVITGSCILDQHASGSSAGMATGIIADSTPTLLKHNLIPNDRETINLMNWDQKLSVILEKAKGKKCGGIFGVPSNAYHFLRRAKDEYSKSDFQYLNDHLELIISGGVNYRMYKKGIEEILERPISFLEAYTGSEGFYAHVCEDNLDLMEFFYEYIFFEFIPLDHYLSGKREERLLITQLEKDQSYVVLVTPGNGAFSYVLGDVIRCVDSEQPRFVLSGRTSMLLNIASEKTEISMLEASYGTFCENYNIIPKDFFVIPKINTESATPYYQWHIEKDEVLKDIPHTASSMTKCNTSNQINS